MKFFANSHSHVSERNGVLGIGGPILDTSEAASTAHHIAKAYLVTSSIQFRFIIGIFLGRSLRRKARWFERSECGTLLSAGFRDKRHNGQTTHTVRAPPQQHAYQNKPQR